ncbi:methionyl-tRNA formyltransferase [Candidatus Acetothermia bacterium]|nr:methionyl-tRNA formyltransferase [Candidatus Acetothermia bacterium]
MKIIFVGTAPLGVPTLRAIAHEHDVLAVFTQPDRPAGRHLQSKPPPIKEAALELRLPIYQPEKINRDVEFIKQLQPELIFTCAYGQILSKKLLQVPSKGCVNLHASLLPKYRGAAPIQWAIVNGEEFTGLTTFLMDVGVDDGPILLQESIVITDDDTTATLHERMATIGPDLVLQTLDELEKGILQTKSQDHSQATYAPKITDEMARIDWSQPAQKIHNLIRGFNPVPGAFTFLNGSRLKVYQSRIIENANSGKSGEILRAEPAGMIVRTGVGALELLEVQPESRRRMSALDFVRGHKEAVGASLG